MSHSFPTRRSYDLIAYLKHRLRLCSPSLDEYRPYVPAQKFEERSRLTLQQQIDRYAASLAPLASQPSADSLSLLSALVAESFITDHDVLLDLHRDYFKIGRGSCRERVCQSV